MKVNAQGDVLWEQPVGATNERAVDVDRVVGATENGQLAVVSNIGPESSSQIRISIVDAEGGSTIRDLVLDLHLNGTKQVAHSVTSLENQDALLITGYADKEFTFETNPNDASVDESDLLALTVSADFSVVENALNAGGETKGALIKGYELPAASDAPFVVFGFSNKPVAESFDMNYTYYIPQSSVFAEGWSIGSAAFTEQLASVKRSDPGTSFLMAGTVTSDANIAGDIYLVKYGSSFDIASLNKVVELNRDVVCVDAAFARSSNYLVLANEYLGNDLRNILVAKLDYRGEPIWTRSFGTETGDDTGAAVAVLPDGRIAILGTMELETNKKMALIVLNQQGGL
jgi:hypothetical protein